MKFSTKGRYALRIMIDLAQNHTGKSISLRDISARQGITIKYLEQIMPLLTKAELVESHRGKSGGYVLAREAKDYTVGEILRSTEGSLAPLSCVEDDGINCERKDACKTMEFWKGLWEVMNTYTDSVTLDQLLK